MTTTHPQIQIQKTPPPPLFTDNTVQPSITTSPHQIEITKTPPSPTTKPQKLQHDHQETPVTQKSPTEQEQHSYPQHQQHPFQQQRDISSAGAESPLHGRRQGRSAQDPSREPLGRELPAIWASSRGAFSSRESTDSSCRRLGQHPSVSKYTRRSRMNVGWGGLGLGWVGVGIRLRELTGE